LLKPFEQSALAQLAIFHGGCTLEAAEAVIDLEAFEDEPWVMDTVEALVDHSLLRRTEPLPGHSRYRMLESVREYATQKMGDDAAPVSLRHAQYFATFGSEEFVDSLDTHGGVQRCQKLRLEMENLVASVERAIAASEWELAAYCSLAVGAVFMLKGPLLDGIALLSGVPSERLASRLRARLLVQNGHLLHFSGQTPKALTHFEQALSIHREVGDRRAEGLVLGNLGGLHHEKGKVAEALTHYERSLAIAREVGNRRNEGHVLSKLGTLHKEQGRIAEALTHFEQAIAIAREVGNRRSECVVLGNLGGLHLEHGRIAEALTHYEQALAIAREVGDRRSEGLGLAGLGVLHQDQGRIAEALTHYEQAIAIQREMGNRRNEGVVLGNLGDLLYNDGDLSAAEQHLQQAIEIGDENFPAAAGAFRGTLALIRVENGALDEARALLERGDSQLRGVYALELAKLLCKRARVEQLAGDATAGSAALAEADTIAEEMQTGPDSDLGQELTKARTALAD
jgi:tetratricopeptide (TPR) repeat protein